MQSKLSEKEFLNRLKQNTVIGNPKKKGNPLGMMETISFSKKRFFGDFNSGGFRITNNGILKMTPFYVDGVIESNREGLEIDLEVKKIWFGYLFIRIIPVGVLFLIGLLIFVTEKHMPNDAKIAMGIAGVFMLLPILITNGLRRKLLRDFKTIFEIEKK